MDNECPLSNYLAIAETKLVNLLHEETQLARIDAFACQKQRRPLFPTDSFARLFDKLYTAHVHGTALDELGKNGSTRERAKCA